MLVSSKRVSGLIALVTSAALAMSAAAQSLNDDVRRVMLPLKLANAKVGVSIVDVTSGETLADHHANDLFIPASNMKVLTSGAALMALGTDFAFRTELRLVGEKLVILGDGDPALGDNEILEQSSPKLSVGQLIEVLADAVVKAGVKQIQEVVVDDRVFDREYVHPSWPKEQLRNWYCCEVSGVNFHTNTVSFFFQPTSNGRTPGVTLEPMARWIEIDNKAKTITSGPQRIGLDRISDSNRFLLTGELRSASSDKVTIHEPGLFFAQLLGEELLKKGVKIANLERIEGSTPSIRLVGKDEQIAKGRTIAAITTTLEDAMKRCNADSYNLYAEAFCKRIGHEVTKEPGSWSNGSAVTRMLLTEKLGPRFAATTTLADGSGMSRLNQVAPETMTHWLKVVAKDAKIAEMFTESLATTGEGTLKRRFADVKLKNELRAKSGYITGVRCLSGYVINKETGRKVAFSILVNNAEKDEEDRSALKLHEGVVQVIDKWLTKRGETAIGQGG